MLRQIKDVRSLPERFWLLFHAVSFDPSELLQQEGSELLHFQRGFGMMGNARHVSCDLISNNIKGNPEAGSDAGSRVKSKYF